ncbi:MAG: hypothetical protein ABNG98_08815 [Flavobacterium sp.]|jgi:hypothetical protein
MELEKENKTKNVKFFSKNAIGIATFFGGPLAAGYLVSENYKSLDKRDDALNALFIGIGSTIILFLGLYMVPDNIIDKVPSQLLPIIYTAIIYYIVDLKQGEVLKLHEKNGNSFYSGWKAAGIGFVCLLIMTATIFISVYFSSNDESLNLYDAKMEVFYKNESESIEFYNHLETKSAFALIKELDEEVIPKWNQNIKIIDDASKITDLPDEVKTMSVELKKYSQLRIKAFNLFKKAIQEDTSAYSNELDKIHNEIDAQLKILGN